LNWVDFHLLTAAIIHTDGTREGSQGLVALNSLTAPTNFHTGVLTRRRFTRG